MAWRRKQWLRCTKLKICKLLSAALIVTVVLKVNSVLETPCNNDEMHENFKQLCHLYKNSAIDGSFCNHLCITHEILPRHCLGTRHGKQIAFAKWNNDIIILKSENRFFHNFDILAFFDNKMQAHVLPSKEEFFTLLQGSIESRLGMKVPENGSELLALMWPDSYKRVLDHRRSSRQYQLVAMNSLWSLTQQSEYVQLQYFNKNKYLPRVLGTCGHFYAVEYAPSGLLDPNLFDVTASTVWRERAKLALGILDVLSSFETDYLEPLYMCDIKGSQFGVASDGTVKMIDVDTLFLRSELERQFFHHTCTAHKDCDFFDCQAWCDLKTQQCQKKILNNNLQVVCEKIFKGNELQRGLLSHAPHQWTVPLQRLLNHCANPTDDQTDRRGVTSAEDFYKLKRLLKFTLL